MGYPYFLAPFESVSTLSLSTWYHIAFIKSGNNWLLYINGSLDNSVVNSGTVSTSTDNLTIGKFSGGAYFFQGNIDEVSIFDTDQSSNVATIYNGGTPTTITGAVAHYKLGDSSTFSTNWTVPDEVGTNDGTSNGMLIDARVGEAPNSVNNALSYNMDLIDRVEDTPPTP